MSTTTTNERVQKHRESLRKAGLRPLQIWVPDTRAVHFAEECRRQSLLVAQVDGQDEQLNPLLDELLDDVEGWDA